MTETELQEKFLELQEKVKELEENTETLKEENTRLENENNSIRELNQKYFLKLSQGVSTPETPQDNQPISCEDFAKTLKI